MAEFILSAGDQIVCAHGGRAMPLITSPRVRVKGLPVVTQTVPYTIAGCSNPPPPTSVGPCILANWVKPSLRVKSMGQALLLRNSQAICVPTGTPLLVAVTQVHVKAL
jgi:hypothetical protein